MITSLRLQNFRGYQDAQFEFNDGVHIIVGPNASGKTSLLEALLVLARGSSFKGQEADLIRFGSDWARLDGVAGGGETRTVKLEKSPDGRVAKSYILNDVPKIRLAVTHDIPVVLFEPTHMNLLAGEPALRRQFLDDILTVTTPGYAVHLKNFRRALFQRNTLLKKQTHASKQDELFVWDLRLSDLGGVVYAARKTLVTTMSQGIGTVYNHISGRDESVDAVYSSDIAATDYTNALLARLTANHDKDLERGFTTAGPHRDDLVLELRGHDARIAASRGETRSLLLALKILELQELERACGQKPLLLLDDVFSELDGHRRQSLADALQGHQVFITTTDADLVVEHFMDSATILPLSY